MVAIMLKNIVRKKKRRGRGIGRSGAKSGRGMKGQKSRAGYRRKAGFEGGQTPLYMRLPKGRGTKQTFRSQAQKPVVINIHHLNTFDDGSVVGPGVLRKSGIVHRRSQQVKLVGNSKIAKKLTVRVHTVSKTAQEAIEKAGGKVELIEIKKLRN